MNAGLPGTGISSRTKISGSKHKKTTGQAADSGAIESIAGKLSVTVKDVTHKGGTNYDLSYDFSCMDCGGTVLSGPDDGADSGQVFCKSCGIRFGSLGEVKALAQHVGQKELMRRGLV